MPNIRTYKEQAMPNNQFKYLNYFLAIVLLALTSGCELGWFGIHLPGQRKWLSTKVDMIDEVSQSNDLTRLELEQRIGKPDAEIPGWAFATGCKVRDDFRAYVLGFSAMDDASDLFNEQWDETVILVYDEKSHYLWPTI